MTIDEAIIYLSDMKIKIAIPKAAVQARLNNDALNMAIEALRCSEIPNNSDTISRQHAIDALCKSECGCSNAECRYNGGTDFCVTCDNVKELKSLPSAQPEIIRCKDCKYYKYGICMKIGANKSFYGFCDWAERGEEG